MANNNTNNNERTYPDRNDSRASEWASRRDEVVSESERYGRERGGVNAGDNDSYSDRGRGNGQGYGAQGYGGEDVPRMQTGYGDNGSMMRAARDPREQQRRSHYESQVGHYGAGSYNSGSFDTGYGSGGFGGSDYTYNSGYANGMNSGYGGYDDRQQRMVDPQQTRGRWNRDEQSDLGRYQGAGQSGYGAGQVRGPQNYGQRGFGANPASDHPMMNQRGLGHAGKGPANFQRNDERIREDVCQHLADHDDVDASQIEVAVSGGEVTLSGAVDHRSTKRLAEDIAHHVSGVKDVMNQIRIGTAGATERGTSASLATTGTGNGKKSSTPS